jgi:nicotinamide riboside kinase
LNLKRNYTYSDVEHIAKKQISQLEKEIKHQTPLIFVDTWLIITKVWFEFVFKKEPKWLDIYLKQINIDLYLLCDIDIPWEYDTVRENGGEKRVELQKRYIQILKEYNCNFVTVSGKENERLITAKHFVQKLLDEPSF